MGGSLPLPYLVAHGETASRVALAPAVMGRVRRERAGAAATGWGWLRWGLGGGFATAAAAVVAVLLLSPRTTANTNRSPCCGL